MFIIINDEELNNWFWIIWQEKYLVFFLASSMRQQNKNYKYDIVDECPVERERERERERESPADWRQRRPVKREFSSRFAGLSKSTCIVHLRSVRFQKRREKDSTPGVAWRQYRSSRKDQRPCEFLICLPRKCTKRNNFFLLKIILFPNEYSSVGWFHLAWSVTTGYNILNRSEKERLLSALKPRWPHLAGGRKTWTPVSSLSRYFTSIRSHIALPFFSSPFKLSRKKAPRSLRQFAHPRRR